MFKDFSETLSRSLAAIEYESAGISPDDADCWTVSKPVNASLCIVQVLDCDSRDMMHFAEEHARYMTRLAPLTGRYRSVTVLYLLVSDAEKETPRGSLSFDNASRGGVMQTDTLTFGAVAEPYDNQTVYAVFWRVRLDTRTITVPDGQPRKLFGLRRLVEMAMDDRALDGTRFLPVQKHAVYAYVLVAINALIVVLMYMDGYPDDAYTAARFGAIVPSLVRYSHEYWRLFTAMFVHFGVLHFLANALGMVIFGARVERYFGRTAFIATYLLSGLCGSVCSLLFTNGYAAGASGAVYGLVGASLAFALISKRALDQLTGYTMLLYAVMGLAMGFVMSGVDNFAHIGGLLTGAVCGAVIAWRHR